MKQIALPAIALLLAAPSPAQDSCADEGCSIVVDFELDAVRFEDPPPQAPFGSTSRNFQAKLELLRQIAADPGVAGLRLRLEGAVDYARSVDLAAALREVQAAGKSIVCWAEVLDKNGLRLAALSDHLAVPPSGMILLDAPSVEVFYFKELLAKLGAEVEVLHVGAFKTAYEELAREGMSDEQRETIRCLLEEFWNATVDAIATGRGMSRESVEELFGLVLVPPQRALEAGLIDALSYEDEFEAEVAALLGGPVLYRDDYGDPEQPDFETLFSNPFTMMASLSKLFDPPAEELPDEPRVAIVYATGEIASGKSSVGFDGTVSTMGSDTLVAALEEALADEYVRAVVLRVNSPGGSALASDAIWRAVERVRAKKPVVASMGQVAASGGYWISMGCDRILAQPTTITGSLGVVSALPNVSAMLSKLGVDVEVVACGPRAAELATLENGPSPFLKERITAMMQRVYDQFLTKAAAGRHMERTALEPHAHGRVWTGRQALEHGLVDGLGGLEDAIALACELGGGLDPESTRIVELPSPPDFLEQFEELFEVRAAARAGVGFLLESTGVPADVVSAARALLAGDELLHGDRIQCRLPFALHVR